MRLGLEFSARACHCNTNCNMRKAVIAPESGARLKSERPGPGEKYPAARPPSYLAAVFPGSGWKPVAPACHSTKAY
jgi:hypothetical protein